MHPGLQLIAAAPVTLQEKQTCVEAPTLLHHASEQRGRGVEATELLTQHITVHCSKAQHSNTDCMTK